MSLANRILQLRKSANLSQEQFAELFHVSQQAVQRWEGGTCVPDLDKIIKISKHFDVSIDALVLDRDTRLTEELNFNKRLRPKYANLHQWESYSSNLMTEYQQCMEEGKDVAMYHDVLSAVSLLPKNEAKKQLGDILFDVVLQAPYRKDYPYVEPSDLEGIRALRIPSAVPSKKIDKQVLRDKVYGAWTGRICGCLLGKTVEGIMSDELIPFLKETGNYPMYRYIHSSDITEDICDRYTFPFKGRAYADTAAYMPYDDDTNYIVLDQEVIRTYGRNFTPYDMSRAWLHYQPKDEYCTAERVAFCNFVNGYEPPQSAMYKNPYREWIGAQIRGDYFGYINPGDPEMAAEMAFRDASISHVKNGIYGEMFAAAMIACAAVTDDIEEIIAGGLAQIPHTSRLYEAVTEVVNGYRNGVAQEECFRTIHQKFDEHTSHGWCHTISNAMIVTAALLYGKGDYGKSVCMAVQAAFDTDCNGATVGSVLGMVLGMHGLDPVWTDPIHDTLETTLFGLHMLSISERVDMTMEHIAAKDT